MTPPLRIRFSLLAGILFAVLAAANLGLGALDGASSLLVLGSLLALLAVLQLFGVAVVITAEEVQVRNPLQMTVRRVRIEGLSDLRIEGSRLLRASDGRKITGLGRLSARAEDVDLLKEAMFGGKPA